MKLKDYDFDDIDEIEDIEDIEDLDDLDIDEIDESVSKKSKSKSSKIEEDDLDIDLDDDDDTLDEAEKEIDDVEDDTDEEIEEEEVEKKKTKKAEKIPVKTSSKKASNKKVVVEDDDEEEEEKSGKGGLIGKIIALIVVVGLVIFLLIKGCSNGKEYTIKFDTDGGSSISEQKVKKNDKVAVPVDPKKDGYDFAGWYVGDKKYDFDSKVTSSFIIKAKWEEVENASVTGVNLDQTMLTMLPNDTMKLVATVEPSNAGNKNITWTVSNPAIATVDNEGNVKAIKEGTVIVTATTEEGGFTAACTVTVSNNVVKVTGLTLDKNSVELSTGSTGVITATVTPSNATNKGVLWTSSDDSVVSVANGRLTAKKEGTATITATTKDGDYKKTATVTVKDVAVTGVSIKNAKALTIGDKLSLQAVVAPTNASNKSVTWSSSNTSVATIDSNGNVVAKGEGSTVITVTTKDGNKTASVTIKVNKPVAATGVTINKSSLTLTEGGSSTLTATVVPTNAANKSVTWSSSNPSVATVSAAGKVTAKSAGTAVITVTTKDGGYTATCNLTVNEKPATYQMIIAPIEQEGTGAVAQYSVTITRNGTAFTGYTGYNYNGKNSKSSTLASGEVNTSVSTAKVTVNGVTYDAKVIYR